MADSNRTALVVDDSKIVRKVVRKILEPLSFRVEEAENGRQALEFCGHAMPALIMLDWHMPEMDGMSFLKTLRGMAEGGRPFVIFCTTETQVEHIQAAIDAGANEYVMKPFDQEILRAKLVQIGLLDL